MTTDWKALCTELVDELEVWISYGDEVEIADAHELIDRAREALAQSEPETPKNCWLDDEPGLYYPSPCVFDDPSERVEDCMYARKLQATGKPKTGCKYYRQSALAQPEPEGPTDQELLRLYKVATPCHAVEEYTRELDFAHAVLARWGRPTPQPLPTSDDAP